MQNHTDKYSYIGRSLLSGRCLPKWVGSHHHGMRYLKALFGDPCPGPGYELSLQVIDGPGVYWAMGSPHGKHNLARPLLVSRFPDDYAWETAAENRETDRQRRYALLERKVCQ